MVSRRVKTEKFVCKCAKLSYVKRAAEAAALEKFLILTKGMNDTEIEDYCHARLYEAEKSDD